MAGKVGRSGRKSKADELGLQSLLDRAWPESKRVKFFSELAKLAENPRTLTGMEAGKLLAAYTYGKPTERVEHSGNDEKPIKIIIEYDDKIDAASAASGATDDQNASEAI